MKKMLTVIAIGFIILLAACSGDSVEVDNALAEITDEVAGNVIDEIEEVAFEPRVYTMETHLDILIVTSLEDLYYNTAWHPLSLIVVGRFTGFDSTWNIARNPHNRMLESEEHYIRGHKYVFEIDEVLHGRIDSDQILVGMSHSERTSFQGLTIMINNPLYVEPIFGDTYILFLGRDEHGGFFWQVTAQGAFRIVDGFAETASNLTTIGGTIREEFMLNDGNILEVITSAGGGFILEDFVAIQGHTLDSLRTAILEVIETVTPLDASWLRDVEEFAWMWEMEEE